MCIFDVNNLDKQTCLHCGKGKPDYCEKCYQELIGQNAKLQLENSLREDRTKGLMKVIEQYRKKVGGVNNDREN